MGARIFKTGLAVTLAAAICQLLNIPVMFAALAALMNIKPSVVQSWENALEQVGVHVIGVAAALLIGLAMGANPLTMGLATAIVLYLCGRLKWTGGMAMGVISALFILTVNQDQFLNHAVQRSQAIFVGLVVGLLVNYFILPPRYGQRLRASLRELSEQISAQYEDTIRRFVAVDPLDPETAETVRRDIQLVIDRSSDYLARYREQVGRVRPKGTQPNNNPAFLAQYLAYLEGIFERTVDLAAVTRQRLERRKAAGCQPVGAEFQEILAYLQHGAGTAVILNEQLRDVLFAGKQVAPQKMTPGYWEEMAGVIESWHGGVSGTYYLYALVEIGTVIAQVKWITGQARELFKKIQA